MEKERQEQCRMRDRNCAGEETETVQEVRPELCRRRDRNSAEEEKGTVQEERRNG